MLLFLIKLNIVKVKNIVNTHEKNLQIIFFFFTDKESFKKKLASSSNILYEFFILIGKLSYQVQNIVRFIIYINELIKE